MKMGRVQSVTWEKDGTTIDCAVFGTGSRALVLIPGLSFQRVKGSALPLAWMYRIFGKEYTVYVIDKKDQVPSGYTIRDLAADTDFAMERLGLGSADVFGVSQGGMIGQYLAIDYPDRVRKLVLGVTAARTNPVMEAAVSGWIDMARRQDYEGILLDMLPKMYSAEYVKKYRRLFPLLAKAGKPRSFDRFLHLAEACLTCNAYPELHKIACPVLVLGGERDQVVTGEASREIAQALGCGLIMYPGLGHGAYEEAKDFNRQVLEFLSA